MVATKRYTIKFGYAGVSQYADFFERKGKLINPRFSVSWAKSNDIPSVAECETIDEALVVIKGFANNAELYLIDGSLPSVNSNKKASKLLKSFNDKMDKFIKEEATKYWENVLEPIMVKNNWFIGTSHLGAPVLIYKNESGEWDNIPYSTNELAFEILCGRFAKAFSNGVEFNLKTESRPWAKGFQPFISALETDYLIERGIYIDL